jgi:glutaredoxin-like protein NrdH
MKVTIYTKPGCGPCAATRHAMESRGVPFETVNVMDDDAALDAIKGLGYLTVPVVLVQDGDAAEHWGGFQLDRIADLAGKLRMQEIEE